MRTRRIRRQHAAGATFTVALISWLPCQEQSHEELRAQVVGELQRSRWHSEAERAITELLLHDAKTECGVRVEPEVWPWLAKRSKLRSAVVWAAANDPSPKLFVCLDRLRRHDALACERLPQLAVGFAYAWSSGQDDTPQRRWDSWTQGRSPVPTMEQSFAWYAKHRRKLVFAIDKSSWPVLAFTALNDVPLDERAWVLQRYRSKKIEDLHDIFGQVPYIHDGLDGKAKTLANMIALGGVCTVNTQFQMAAMRTLGIPATFAGGPGHCWPCWLAGAGRNVHFDRANDLGNADGTIGQWVQPWQQHESDLRLLANALAEGDQRLRAVDLCAAALRHCADEIPSQAPFALLKLLEANSYAQQGWRALAAAIRSNQVDTKTVVRSLRLLEKSLQQHPRAAARLLREMIPTTTTAPCDAAIVDAYESACRAMAAGLEGDAALDLRRSVVEFLAAAGQTQRAASMRVALLRETTDHKAPEVAPATGKLRRSRMVGGGGGSAFVDAHPKARLVGLRYSMANYSGHRVIGSIQPLFELAGNQIAGAIHGNPNNDVREVLAAKGTAIIGCEVQSGDLLDDIRLIVAPANGGRVDLSRVAFGPWVSGKSSGWGSLLGGADQIVVGVHGRSGALLDAFGLVVK